MKTLDVQARLDFARAGVAVLRALQTSDTTVRYKQFATAIGLIADGGRWEAWHRQQVGDILAVMGAVENQAGGKTGTEPLRFERVVDESGQPGPGFYKSSRIVTT